MEKTENNIILTQFDTTSLDNKKLTKPHGQLMDEIIGHFVKFIPNECIPLYFVREKAFNARAAQSEMGIYKVVGMMDWILYRVGDEWHEIYPVSVKKYITGSGKADKQQVADYLKYYFGQREYENDDESDAAAVGAAFLIENNLMKTFVVEEEPKGGETDVSATSEIHQSV